MNEKVRLDSAATWNTRSEGGYGRLKWVSNDKLLSKIRLLAGLQGYETVVDIGTGSGAVFNALAPRVPFGEILGLDISPKMLASVPRPLPPNGALLLANAYNTGLKSKSVDLVTARNVLHNLSDIEGALLEFDRILNPGGRMIINEYVPVNEVDRDFEKLVFDTKEPGRHLLTDEEWFNIVLKLFPSGYKLQMDWEMLFQTSTRDWMENSSLPKKIQEEIISYKRSAPPQINSLLNATITPYDALVDIPYFFITVTKPGRQETRATACSQVDRRGLPALPFP